MTAAIFVAALVLSLVAVCCWAVYAATREKFKGVARGQELELSYLEAEVVRLSTRPPPPQPPAPEPEPYREPFLASGSIVPPPPAYLFELVKQPIQVTFPAVIPPPPSWLPPPSLPAPPRAPIVDITNSPDVKEHWNDDEEAPPTPRSFHSELIARTLRPPPPK